MNKLNGLVILFVLLVTAANLYLCLGIYDDHISRGPARMVGLIVMLAAGALFADKFSNNPYAPGFIKFGSLIGMVVLFFILYFR